METVERRVTSWNFYFLNFHIIIIIIIIIIVIIIVIIIIVNKEVCKMLLNSTSALV